MIKKAVFILLVLVFFTTAIISAQLGLQFQQDQPSAEQQPNHLGVDQTEASAVPLLLAAKETKETKKTKKTKPKKTAVKPSGKGKVSKANVFNRLLKKKAKGKNAAPPDDGIHDAGNEATHVLQPPKIAYDGLPKSPFGNYIDWVKSLDQKLLNPRNDRVNPKEGPFIMDMDIVRPVKASVPDVVFPHRQHTEWLHCSNCHPKIFIPQKGANQINMSAILLGQKCGVCHGKVSFPITTRSCKKCHSKAKPKNWKPPLSKATLKNPWR